MIRICSAFLVLGASAFAQSRVDLLQQVAERYRNAMSFEVKGTASALAPGTSWRVSYEFETEGAQPAFLPLNVRTASIRVTTRVGNAKETSVVPGATDPKPQSWGMAPFGQFTEITRRLIEAQKIGTEPVTVQGRAYLCEVIDAVYDYSPSFKPNSAITHKHLSVAPADLLVLRETNSLGGFDWTADVTSFSFDQPPSESMVKHFQAMAEMPKDRPEWVGREAPDFTVQQLSGKPVTLSQLRGKPILLDFWSSYCGPCRLITLHAQELANKYKADGLTVLTLTQDTTEDAKLWTSHYHVGLPVLIDSSGTAFKKFDVQGVPVAILVGRDGKVSHYWVGLDRLSTMDSVLGATLQNLPVSP